MEGEKCDKCSCPIMFVETPKSIHYGKYICSGCGKWFKWKAAENPEGLRKKVSKYSTKRIREFHKKKNNFCFFCLRNDKELGLNETLTRDHIEEIQEGGKDELENLQILCTACHKLKNWARLYMNWHLRE